MMNEKQVEAALRLAREALQEFMTDYQSEDGMNSMKHYAKKHHAALTAINEALAAVPEAHKQPAQQKPVDTDWDAVHEKLIEVWNRQISADEGLDEIQDLIYTSPQSKPWVGLTDEERLALAMHENFGSVTDYACAIEAKLREKNGGNHG